MENSIVGINKSELVAEDGGSERASSGLLAREAYVLGHGMKDGLAQGFTRSLHDMCDFAEAVHKNPGTAIVDLAKNHWSEAALAAGLSFLAPLKWAGTLIAAVSMRGVAGATYESMALAADPLNDVGKLKDSYASSMASETQALVNSLPLTLAGGIVGKAGANAVFGKNFGAWDFAAGERDWSDVKSNLWDLHDKVLPPKAKMVVVDLDATLVSTNKHLTVGNVGEI